MRTRLYQITLNISSRKSGKILYVNLVHLVTKYMTNKHPALIGLFQALGIAVYCGLIAGFFQIADKFFNDKPGMIAPLLMLTLLVFSAAMCGLIVFGYPIYLAMNQDVKRALKVLFYTLLFVLIIILVIISIIII